MGSDGLGGGDWNDSMRLNTTAAEVDDASKWNDTVPSSSVFTLGINSDVNATGENYVAYCFDSIEGYSKVGSYTGNGNVDGSFVYTGFRPAYVMQKNITSTNGWFITDDARNTYNIVFSTTSCQ